MSGIFGSAVGSVVVVDYIGFAVFIEEECRVDALYFGKHYGVAPFAGRVLGLDEEIARADIGRDHVVGLVGRIVGDVGREDAAAHMLLFHVLEL